MAARPSFRGRMGVEDGKHGEQDRDGEAVLVQGRGGSVPSKDDSGDGPDSKTGGRTRGGNRATTSAEFNHGDGGDESPPNTVAMPVMARGKSAPGAYDNTGDKLNVRGSLGNTKQATYNDRPGQGASSEGGKKGSMLGSEPSNFYNNLGGNTDDPDGEADSGGNKRFEKRIEGFGGGKDTFAYKSDFYNDVGESGTDNEANSGSGLVEAVRSGSGSARKISGFSEDSGLKSGMI